MGNEQLSLNKVSFRSRVDFDPALVILHSNSRRFAFS